MFRRAHVFLYFVCTFAYVMSNMLSCHMSLCSQFRSDFRIKLYSVRFYLKLFVGGLIYYLLYLCNEGWLYRWYTRSAQVSITNLVLRMSFRKIWTKCDLDDYEAGSFVKNDLNNSNNYRCGKKYINTEQQTKLRTNFILMTINFNYKYRKVISSRFLNITNGIFRTLLSTIQRRF